MSKKRLGISIYPEFSKDEDTLAYLDTAASYGFDVLFMALIAGKEDREQVIQRYKGITTNAKELGFEICVDANPMVFKRMGCNASIFAGPIDLSFFKELDVDVIRLDLGMTDMEEAFLSRNKEGIKICLNGATLNDHVGHVLNNGGDPERILGCHNYYPHRYTGVSLDFFSKGTKNWTDHHLRLQSFVTSAQEKAFGPWPVTEGLPTLEMHRDLPIDVQMKHYLLMGTVDDIIIGNCFASEKELAAMSAANRSQIAFNAKLSEGIPSAMKEKLSMNLSRRADQNDYLIRTLESRLAGAAKVEPFNTVDIVRGDILIDNELYGQYSGEVQIALQNMKNSGKTNVVGHIRPEELILLDYLKGSQQFRFVFDREDS